MLAPTDMASTIAIVMIVPITLFVVESVFLQSVTVEEAKALAVVERKSLCELVQTQCLVIKVILALLSINLPPSVKHIALLCTTTTAAFPLTRVIVLLSAARAVMLLARLVVIQVIVLVVGGMTE